MPVRSTCLSRRFDPIRSREPRPRARPRGSRRVALGLWALSLVALPSAGRAQGSVNAAGAALGGVALIVGGELLIPDLQYEWGPGTDDAHTTMVWPLSASAKPMRLGRYLGLGLDGRIELQVRPADGYRSEPGVRGVLATRVPVFLRFGGDAGRSMDNEFPGIYGEAGLVGGNAGKGTLLGGGVFFGTEYAAIALGYRALDLADIGRRHTVGLDLHFSLPVGRMVCERGYQALLSC